MKRTQVNCAHMITIKLCPYDYNKVVNAENTSSGSQKRICQCTTDNQLYCLLNNDIDAIGCTSILQKRIFELKKTDINFLNC